MFTIFKSKGPETKKFEKSQIEDNTNMWAKTNDRQTINVYLVQTLRKLLYQIKTMIYSDLRRTGLKIENYGYYLK